MSVTKRNFENANSTFESMKKHTGKLFSAAATNEKFLAEISTRTRKNKVLPRRIDTYLTTRTINSKILLTLLSDCSIYSGGGILSLSPLRNNYSIERPLSLFTKYAGV